MIANRLTAIAKNIISTSAIAVMIAIRSGAVRFDWDDGGDELPAAAVVSSVVVDPENVVVVVMAPRWWFLAEPTIRC